MLRFRGDESALLLFGLKQMRTYIVIVGYYTVAGINTSTY